MHASLITCAVPLVFLARHSVTRVVRNLEIALAERVRNTANLEDYSVTLYICF